jgi:argininosuccinate lyase
MEYLFVQCIAEELIIWNSDGFNLINLSDKVVTGSSIMPQKKNPDLLEYLRGKSGNTYGNLFSMLTILKGLPLSYFKDLQDDKEIIFKSNDILLDCLNIFNEILKNVTPNKKKMLELASSGYITATDLADYLVKNHSMSFRKAYQKTAAIVNLAEKKKKNLNELTLDDFKKIEPKLTNDVLKVFDLKNSVKSKKSYGGTSFDNIKRMIIKYKKR